MKQLLLIGAIAVTMPFMAVAQTAAPVATPTTSSVTLPDPGMVPGDFFYFLDRWSEGFGNIFTFKTESKALRALEHAQERASEIHAVLTEKGFSAPEVAQARKDFGEHLNRATTVVAGAKARGADVSAFVNDVDEEFELSKDMLKEAFRGYRDDLKDVEKNLMAQLNAAIKAGDTVAQAAIETEIDRLIDEGFSALDEEGLIDDQFEDEKGYLENALGEEQAAESHIMNAERAHANLLHEATVRGLTLNEEILLSFDDMMESAQTAMKDGDFETAKEYAKDAKAMLNEAHQDLNTKEEERDFSRSIKEKGPNGDFFDLSDLESDLSDIDEGEAE
ncbi:MAG: hypothetical protein A2481_02800 [Candidatus Yonathbacteria bacterium RIFOXYC2_FULL_47_9]|nr:MAG: hypothetical protein A2481_02800 [Candidatus Yonathbacteria bacterium RIFOXYC2_FULL_47_9]HAT68084.1 hypothetical protein [Candidatus Yonathbacteria bacterium]